jgi:hypothetical protein
MPKRKHLKKPPAIPVLAVVLAALTLGFLLVGEGGCQNRAPGASVVPMQLEGRWLGMTLSSTGSASAAAFGVPPSVTGVAVTQVPQTPGARILQSGIAPGDVIVALNGATVNNLAEFYAETAQLNATGGVTLDILRQGQRLTAAVPPLAPTPQMMQAQPTQAFAQAQPMPQPTLLPQAAPQTAMMAAPQTTMMAAPPMAPQASAQAWTAQAAPAGQFYCPTDGVMVPPTAVSPSLRCPHCAGALLQVPGQ